MAIGEFRFLLNSTIKSKYSSGGIVGETYSTEIHEAFNLNDTSSVNGICANFQ